MKIGIFYDNVKHAYPDVNDDLILLKKVSEAGYSYIDIDYDELIKKTDDFFKESERLSIGLSVYAFSNEKCILSNGIGAVESLPFLSKHNVNNLMMVCMPSNKDMDSNNIISEIINSLNSLCEKAEQYGMTVSVEDFDSHDIPCGKCEDMLWFGSKVPSLKYTLDTGNFAFFGEDVLECFEKLKGKITHVHLKDRISTENLQVTATGSGSIPIKEIIGRLSKCGYDGIFSVEMFGVNVTPEVLKNAAEYVLKAQDE